MNEESWRVMKERSIIGFFVFVKNFFHGKNNLEKIPRKHLYQKKIIKKFTEKKIFFHVNKI